MLKGRGRDARAPPAPTHSMMRPSLVTNSRPPQPQRVPLAKPEPDYEVVEFPSDQYVNAKLQPPPPPPPRPPAGHSMQNGASCGLCGGGGARVRCTECGRRALCASCDDMYHRHPKRRNHQRQALTSSQIAVDDRPPLPPKGTPPVPPPRRHKISASPNPIMQDQRRATLGHPAVALGHASIRTSPVPPVNLAQHPAHLHSKMSTGNHLGSMPFLPTTMPHPAPALPHIQHNVNTLGHLGWNRPRGSLQGFNIQHVSCAEPWESPETASQGVQSWDRPLRRGASVLELGGPNAACGVECGGCAAAAAAWRYGSCATLDQSCHANWPAPPPSYFGPPPLTGHLHPHHHPPQTPQSYRRADSRTASRAPSRTGSRAASPALSMRSRASRRTKHRTPSPPVLPSSDADSESESDSEGGNKRGAFEVGSSGGAAPALGPPPAAPAAAWHCEHCTFLNEAGVRVCAVCCRTPTAVPAPARLAADMENLKIASRAASPVRDDERQRKGKKDSTKRERVSTGCGPSPPKDQRNPSSKTQRLETPNRELNGLERSQKSNDRHDMAVGPSPPRDDNVAINQNKNIIQCQEAGRTSTAELPQRHSVSVGSSPPREKSTTNNQHKSKTAIVQKKSAGTSPPPELRVKSPSPSRAKVSNTGTSPPPQSISTQTYEDPSTWDRAASVSRSRARRRFRDESRRERSRSRHSLSSDTRESERSVRTTGAWEWRDEREMSPPPPRRRASHLDLRRLRRRDSLYGSEATSPERWSGGGRAVSLEALAGGNLRDADRALELAHLLAEAERLGFNADEFRAALSQSPTAPLAWLRERWAGLAGAVRGAAARLAQRAPSEREARAALARHRGAVWPAVTECVEALRRQAPGAAGGAAGSAAVSAARRVRGRVWGPGAGADVEAAPRARAGSESDEYEAPVPDPYADEDEEWEPDVSDGAERWSPPADRRAPPADVDEIARTLGALLLRAGIPGVDEHPLLKDLFSDSAPSESKLRSQPPMTTDKNAADFTHFENDFIDAYNALTRASPLPTTIANFPDEHGISINGENDNISKSDGSNNKIAKRVEGNNNISKEDNLKIRVDEQVNTSDNNNKIGLNNNNLKLNENENLELISIASKAEEIKTKSNNPQTTGNANYNNKLKDFSNHILEANQIEQDVHRNDEDGKNNISKEKLEEKSNNLNDIVDHTQKLIQQMKDEINSDINSIDGGQTETSNSEHDESSSNDEHESSYSETEMDSDHSIITSEENNDFSEEETKQNKNEYSRSVGNINRTSSEENEQFEEALEHIDNLAEDVKNINIELLNSIAHSLQQDHTISLEKEMKEKSTEDIDKIDNKDNLIVAVNTFEELYEEISTSKTNNKSSEQNKIIDHSQNNQILLINKHTVTDMQFKSVAPTKLIIAENRVPRQNAKLEFIETPTQNNSENPPEIIEATEQSTPDSQIEDNTESNTVFSNVSNENNIQKQVNSNENSSDTEKTTQSKILDESPNEKTISVNNKTDVTINKATVNTKSNIPKPIRIPQKSKVAPKVIVSKVPIRKTSTKQYPAPAPPKTHFGNVQSGHVKQLQNKIFNTSVKIAPENGTTDDAKPSTSAIQKKSAPSHPDDEGSIKEGSPPKPAKVKNNYFRETCRTEDEWTDSDSDSQSQSFRLTEKKQSPPLQSSPPPPITLRRVSGNVIDLATIRLPEGSPERQARMLLAEGATETWEQAQLAVELISRGAEPPVALLAALECADLSAALAYLHQDCELCASRFPEHEMVSMLRCTHRCCRECARLYFNVQITERSIADCVCPFCKMPELENLPEDAWLEYFAHLDILLKTLLETDVHELFQRKLRDRTLARDPNFRWCMECSSGFFVHPKQKKLRCPECRSVSCASCRKPWNSNHEGLTCEQYAAWLDDNDPERSVAAVQQHLNENGLECPRCHFKYSLSRGGCMHFTCTQCKYEFCYGCGKPFTMGARCGLSDYCAKLGLHAHHPRNCLFYLRDKEPHELQTLLQMNNVAYETESPTGGTPGRCPVQLQRETPSGLVDGVCGHEAPPHHAGLCKNHYVEHLARRVRACGLDPLPILGVEDLETLVRRAALRPPPRPYGSLEGVYRRALTEIVREKIPLD